MAHHTESNESRLSDQSAYLRFYWDPCCQKLSCWYDVGHIVADAAMVQVESWPSGQHSNVPSLIVVG